MRQRMRVTLWLVLSSILGSLLVVASTETASAAESIPELQWPAVIVGNGSYRPGQITSPTGTVTVPCNDNATDLRTWNASGQLVQQLSHTSTIDDVQNCINEPVVDKNGTVYGVPYGKNSGGSWVYGANLLSYNGSTLKWKYPVSCKYDKPSQVAVGADGNIYATLSGRLIGLAPELQAGQTQPDKVLDIQIPNDCSTKLYPYKDGIMLRGQTSGIRYYSYGGKLLTQPSVSHPSTAQINAAGKLFDYYNVGDINNTVMITMYDPITNMVKWEMAASTPGAKTSGGPNLYPMAGGSVAAVITEQKMAGGVPAVPAENVKTLVILNANGTKWRSVTLPKEIPQGYFGSAINIVADSTGKLAVVRELNFNTGLSNPTTSLAISIGVYDPSSDSWPYQQIMTGDMAKPGGPNDYYLNYSSSGVSLSGNTLFFTARCINKCSDSNMRLYAAKVSGIGMDYPRGDILTANMPPQPAAQPYVAMGDSYSSGEGVVPFVDGTDTTSNKCHRSEQAWAQMVNRNPNIAPSFAINGFAACSGAETKHIKTDYFNGEPPQYTRLNGTTKYVTLTIGGNDMGFSAFGVACYQFEGCAIGSPAHAEAVGKIDNLLPTNLKTTYQKILTEAPGAQIYVMGYPHVAPVKTASDLADNRCPYFFNSGPGDDAWADARAGRDIVERLNARIEATIDDVRDDDPTNSRLHFVDVNEDDSPFKGHEICSTGESFFQNIDQAANDYRYIFHPNEKGQQAYAELALEAMSQ